MLPRLALQPGLTSHPTLVCQQPSAPSRLSSLWNHSHELLKFKFFFLQSLLYSFLQLSYSQSGIHWSQWGSCYGSSLGFELMPWHLLGHYHFSHSPALFWTFSHRGHTSSTQGPRFSTSSPTTVIFGLYDRCPTAVRYNLIKFWVVFPQWLVMLTNYEKCWLFTCLPGRDVCKVLWIAPLSHMTCKYSPTSCRLPIYC